MRKGNIMAKYSIGIDFGSSHAHGVLVDIATGAILAHTRQDYTHKILSALPDGTPLPPDSAFGHPSDYLDALQGVISKLLKKADADQVVSLGLSVDPCSLMPLSQGGAPLCLLDSFASHPHAYIKLYPIHFFKRCQLNFILSGILYILIIMLIKKH